MLEILNKLLRDNKDKGNTREGILSPTEDSLLTTLYNLLSTARQRGFHWTKTDGGTVHLIYWVTGTSYKNALSKLRRML